MNSPVDPGTTLQGLLNELEGLISQMRGNRDLAQTANCGLQHQPPVPAPPEYPTQRGSPGLSSPIIPRLAELLAEARDINAQINDHLCAINRSVG